MTTFEEKAPWIMARLMREFGLSKEDAAAIIGNLGHESGGFRLLQEIAPTVKGSRGGYGWAQWTGPRRRAFEAWCQSKGLKPSSDEANYGYLAVELHGPEAGAIAAVKRAAGLRSKVEAFEMAFERAGVKHYDSREKYAVRALNAYVAANAVTLPPPPDIPKPEPIPVPPPSNAPVVAGGIIGAILLALGFLWEKLAAFFNHLF